MAQEIVGVKIQVESNASEGVGSLRKQLKEAQAEVQTLADKFGATSTQAVAAAKKAAELKDRIGDAKALTDAFNPDRKFQAFASALQGVVGGISAVQGAMGLLGVENEAVEKTLLRVNSAMALSQGLNSILEARDSFKNLGTVIQSTAIFQKANNAATVVAIALQKAFGVATIGTGRAFTILKGAIAATGIGLLVVGLTTLISKISEWTSATDKAAEAQKKLAEQTDLVNSKLENEISVLTSVGGKETEIYNLRVQQTNNELALLRNKFKEKKGLTIEEAKQFGELKTKLITLELDEKNRVKKINEDAQKDKDKKDKEALQKQNEYNEKLKEQRQQRENDSIEFENEVQEIRNKRLEENLKFVADREKQFEEIRQDLSAKLENRIQSVIIPALANQNKIRDEFYEDDLAATKDLQEKKFQAVNAGLDLIGALAGKNEAIANVIYTIQKAIEIGKIVSSTSSAIAQVSAQTAAIPAILPPGVPNPAFPGAVALGAKKIAGLKIGAVASIASIVASSISKFKSGAGGSSVGGSQQTAAVSGGVSSPIAPALPQATLTQLDQRSINQLGSATNRAYVVETDITNSQERIRRINRAARLN